MNLFESIPLLFLCAIASSSALGQQPSGQTGEAVPSAQLQHRSDAIKNHDRFPPPAALKSPATLETAHTPNANALYQALRQRAASGVSFRVKDATLRRDAAELHLTDGIVTLYSQVNGQVTGAVFSGEGVFHLEPPSSMERRQLKLVMKTEVLD